MTPIYQQRLIGSLLLLFVISGIAYFLISSANQTEPEPETVYIAPQAEDDFISTTDVDLTDKIEIVDESEKEQLVEPDKLDFQKELNVVEMKPVEDKKVEIDSPVIASPKSEQNNSTQWYIQIASFSVEKNAQSLQDEIVSLGYDAKIQSSNINSKTIYRVRIGPQTDKSLLEKVSSVLNKKLKIKSQVLRKK